MKNKQNTIRCALFLLLVLFLNASGFSQKQFKAFLFTKTAGWHHESINAGVDAIKKLAEDHFFELVWSDHASRWFTDDMMKQFDVLIFLNTTEDVLNENEQAVMQRFIQSGKGFVGIHAASDTEYDWPWYNQLVGRMFRIHPAIQTAKIKVVDRNFPGMERMPDSYWWTDEWYEFDEEKVTGLHYLLTVDESTYAPQADWGRVAGKGMGDFHPISWYHEIDGGRSFYTALGHLPSKFSEPLFLDHIFGGIYWAATGKGLK